MPLVAHSLERFQCARSVMRQMFDSVFAQSGCETLMYIDVLIDNPTHSDVHNVLKRSSKSVFASLHSPITHQATALYASVQLSKALTRRHCCNEALTLLHPWPRCSSVLVARHTCGIVKEAEERQASATCYHNSFATYCFRGTPVCFRGTPRSSNTWIKLELRFWLHVLLDMITSCFFLAFYVVRLLLHMYKTILLCAQQLAYETCAML